MEINLRFGMHRDIDVIHQEADKIDGQVIPAHILAHQTASTAVFVTSLPDHSYIIDPMTYMFQHSKSEWLNDAGEVHVSLRKMCDGYHRDILAALDAADDDATLGPTELPDAAEFSRCVADFQLTVIARESATKKAAKYLKRYAATAANTPRAVVPPYFVFENLEDAWYAHSLACANATAEYLTDHEVMPVIAFFPGMVSTAATEQIAEHYGEFTKVLLWPGDFAQTSVEVARIKRVRRLVAALRQRDVGVEFLYGGYLCLLMNADGVDAISHGILYTEHKGFGSTPGGGGVPDRYYIPAFHDFRSLSQTDLILHKHRELMCNCDVCREVFRGNPDNIILFADDPELLRRHFLTVRRAEANAVEATALEESLVELDRTYAAYHVSVSRLPNPDSFIDTARMRGLEYLQTWSAAMRAELA